MSNFKVFTQRAKQELNSLMQIENALQKMADELASIKNSAGLSRGSYALLRASIEAIRANIENTGMITGELKDRLDGIIALYEKTEQAILNYDGDGSSGGAEDDAGETPVIPGTEEDFNLLEFLKRGIQDGYDYIRGLIPDIFTYFGDPVNMSTGNYIDEEEELRVSGLYPIRWKRFYNAMGNTVTGPLGTGWRHNHEISVVEKENGYVRSDGQGAATFFVENKNGIYTNVWSKTEILEKTEEGIQITNDRGTQLFDAAGRIVKVCSKKGNYLEYTYEEDVLVSIVSNSGQKIDIFYNDTKERIIRVEAPKGRVLQYGYLDGELVSTDVNGAIKRYEYDGEGTLTKVINPDGKLLLTNTYDEEKRVVEQSYPDGGIMKYSYAKGQTKFYDQNGQEVIFEHDEALRHVKTIYEDGVEAYTYNNRNQRTSFTDKMGNTTHYTYDNKGNRTSVTDALGNKTFMTYNADGKLVSIKDAYDGQTTFVYDKEGNIIEKTDALGNKTVFSEYVNGKPGLIILPSKSRIKIEYDANGNMVSKVRDDQLFENFEYDDANQMTAFIDGQGNRTSYEYDDKGRLTKKIAPNGMEQSYEYTNSGKVLSQTDIAGNKTSYKYNELNKVEEVTDSKGNITRYEYDKMWNVSKRITADGTEYSYEYNKKNQLAKTYINGVENASFTYDANGNKTSVTTDKGGTVSYEYDALNRLTMVTNKSGQSMSISYDKLGNVTERMGFDGAVSRYEYDALGRKTFEENADGTQLFYEYDEVGHVISKKDQFGREAKWSYYRNGLLESRTLPDGKAVSYEYAKNGILKKEVYNNGVELNYEHDSLNRVTKVFDNNGSCKQYDYDVNGNVTSFIDANGNETRYTYGTNGKCSEIVDALGSRLTYTYDRLGNVVEKNWYGKADNGEWAEKRMQYVRDEKGILLSKIDALGNEEHYQYDDHNRVNHITDALGREISLTYTTKGDIAEMVFDNLQRVALEYNDKHQLTGFVDEHGTVTIERDGKGRPVRIVNYDGSTTNYEWGEMGEMRRIIYPDSTMTEYEYNDAFKLAKIIVDNEEIRYEYDEVGRLVSKSYPNNIMSTYEYNAQGKMGRFTVSKAEQLLKECEFTYDSCGNKTGVNWNNHISPDQSVDLRYTYDSLNRISKVYENNNLLRAYEYDGFGNRSALVEKEIRTEYSYNANNQLMSHANYDLSQGATKLIGTSCYTYDKMGNLCKVVEEINGVAKEKEYTYDAQNHVIKAVTEEGISNYKYNGLGQLIEKDILGEKTEYFMDYTKDYHNFIGKKDKNGTQKFIWDRVLAGSVKNGELKSVVTDEMGSISCVFDELGQVEYDMSYDEYGNILNPSEKQFDFGFVGLMQDEGTGLYYAQQRLYDAATGRFNRKDPLLGDTRNVQNQNLYTYCYNKPMTLVDLNGCLPSFGEVWNGITDWADDTWNGVCETADNVCDAIGDAYEWTCDKIEDGCEYIGDKWNDLCDTATETYNYVKDEVVEFVDGAKENFETVYKLYTDPEFHYNRNANNAVISDISSVCDENGNPVANSGWELLPEDKSIYHMITDSEQGDDALHNKKYVKLNPDGSSSEVIICFPPGEEPYIVEDPVNAGTYNYVDSTQGLLGTLGHLVYDVVPYWIHGNQEEDSGLEYALYRTVGPNAISNGWHDVVKCLK